MKSSKKVLRQKMQENLQFWMGADHPLIEKEMKILDKIMSRRNFLKSTSYAALLALVNHGCGSSSSLPSDINASASETEPPTGVSDIEKAALTTPSNIIVDSDVLTSSISHNPLATLGSDDASHIVDEAIMESFNAHVLTIDNTEDAQQSSFKLPDRNYGIPEYIHVGRQNDSDNFTLQIFEKSNSEHHGLKESSFTLENSADKNFNKVVASNGTFHNRIKDSMAYSQKMVLLADTTNAELVLYHQLFSSELLLPSVEDNITLKWSSMDLLSIFKEKETHAFNTIEVIDVNNYSDGAFHAFIYGTIRCDAYYNYGFVVTCNSINDTTPTVTFFAPEYLSIKSSTVSELDASFTGISSFFTLKDFSLFSKQYFMPFTQMVDDNSKPIPEILFSFVSYDMQNATDEKLGNFFLFDDFVGSSSNRYDTQSFFKRYLLHVDTSTDAVIYPLSGYTPKKASISVNSTTFSMTLDVSDIPSVEIYQSLFNQNSSALEHAYVRSMASTDISLDVILATSFYDGNDLGISHINAEVDYDATTHRLTSLNSHHSNSSFNESHYNTDDYYSLWYNDMKVHMNNSESLGACVVEDSSEMFDFHTTQNHQGLLRSYFVVKCRNNDNTISSVLVGMNEKGIENSDAYAYQNHTYLKTQIQSTNTPHYPPMPITLDPYVLHKYHGISEDSEVIYSKKRAKIIDSKTQLLINNDGSELLYSYNHASCSVINKNWAVFEEQKTTDKADIAKHYVNKELHQLHLHVSNLYGLNAQLDSDTFVEIRFSRKVIVKNYTNHQDIKTYHLDTLSSIFLKADSEGMISLEVDAGNQDNQYNGATLEYRFVNKNALSLESDSSVATLDATEGITTAFKQCNISFRMYERFSSENYATGEYGMDSSLSSAKDALSAQLKSEYKSSVAQFANAYSSLHAKSAPNNTQPAQSAALAYANTSFRRHNRCLFCSSASINHFDPAGFISSTFNTLLDDAESAVEQAVKEAVAKLSKSIDDIIKTMQSDISSAAQLISSAIVKAWNAVKSFAEMLWNWLIGVLDMESAFKIGVELNQLYADQLKPLSDSQSKNSAATNAYQIVQDKIEWVDKEISNVVTTAQNGFDEALDSVFSGDYDSDFASHRSSAHNRNQHRKSHTSKSHHASNQLKRLISSLELSLPDVCHIDTSKGPEKIIHDLYENVVKADIETLSSTAKGALESVHTLVQDGSLSSSSLKEPLQTLGDTVFKNMETISKDMVKMPTAMLNGSTILNCLEDEVLGELEKVLLKLYSLVMFRDPKKITSMKMLAYFNFGFSINIIELVVGGAIELARSSVDIRGFIKDGTFRETINAQGSASSGAAKRSSREEEWEMVHATSDAISVVSTFTQVALTASNAVKENRMVQTIKNYTYILKSLTKVPNMLYFAVSEKDFLGFFQEIAYFIEYLAKFGAESTLDDPVEIYKAYVWIAVVAELIASILELTDASTQENAGKIKTVLMIKAITELLVALEEIYIDPTKAKLEAKDTPIETNDLLVISLGLWVVMHMIIFAMNIGITSVEYEKAEQ